MYSGPSKIISKEKIADKTWNLEIEKPKDFYFKAGQYIWLVVPNLSGEDPKGNRRAFSIASPPSQNSITVIFRDSGSGYKKTLLSLSAGSEVQIIGPFGSEFIFNDNSIASEIVIIAGGTGIAPFLSALRSNWQTKLGQHVTVIFINSNSNKEFYIDELKQNAQDKNYLFIHFKDHFTWVNIPQTLNKVQSVFYISGPQGMVDQLVPILLKHGVNRGALHFESNYPSELNNLKPKDIIKFTSDRNNLGLRAIEQSNQHIIITDENGFILYANDAAEKITGFKLEEMRGNTPRLWGGHMERQYYKNFWRKISNGEPYSGQITNRRKNGEIYYAFLHISPIKGKNNFVIGYLATEEDITQQIFLEEQIKKDKAMDDAFLAGIGDGMISIDREGKVIRINSIACKMLDYSENEILNKKIFETVQLVDNKNRIVTEKDRPAAIALSGTTAVTPIGTKYYYVRKNKTQFPVSITISPVTFDGKITGAIEIFRDITKEDEIDKAKSEFVSIASHELRTPLTAIDGLISMILNGEYGAISDNLIQPLHDVSISSERLIYLVNDLLNLSRIQTGKLKYSITQFDIVPVIAEVVKLLQPIAKPKGLILELDNIISSIVSADCDKVKQILNNVLGNSLKFTDKGSIIVSTKVGDDKVTIFVTDTGIGISKDDQKKLFGRFQQLKGSEGRPTGTGLGLHISKEMVSKMGGDLWIEKSESGKGSVFAFSLPIAQSQWAEKVKKEIEMDAKRHPDQK